MGLPNCRSLAQVAVSDSCAFGLTGARIKQTGVAALECRSHDDATLAIFRVFTAAGSNDAVPLAQAQGLIAATTAQVVAVAFRSTDFAGLTKLSATVIPLGAIVLSTWVRVDAGFDNAATVAVGKPGGPSNFLGSTDTNLLLPATNVQGGMNMAPFGSADVVQLTFTGAPTGGSGTAFVTYVIPQL